MAVHVPIGSDVIDVNHGEGVFWKDVRPSDYTVKRCDIESGTDMRALPDPDHIYDALSMDPPYQHTGSGPNSNIGKAMEGRYKNLQSRLTKSMGKGHKGVLDLYREGCIQADRVLKRGTKTRLIVKCKPQIESGVPHPSHVEIIHAFAKLGFKFVDEVLVVSSPRPAPKTRDKNGQFHFDKNHSYFLVFRRGRSPLLE